jgi:protein-S-isoprenylcysteine O-methyltransferase Ste14
VKPPSVPGTSRADAGRGMAKIAAATAVFALWHSLLCSDGAKSFARKLLGARRGTGLYRAFFMAQSVVTSGALILFVLLQPHRVLYRASGRWKWLGWGGQAASLGIALWAFRDLDQARFIGIQGVRALKEGEAITEAQAQGPEIEEDGRVHARGVFRFTRHPIEWAPVGLLFSTPVMKTNWLAFDLLAAIYMFFGALHEETRLLRKGGENYAKYQKQVPFFFGKPKNEPSE